MNNMKQKPVCYDPSRKFPQVFSGTPSFLGVPVASQKEDLHGYTFAVMGTPWEGVCTLGAATGCETATKTIRKASERYCGYLPDYDFDIFDHFSACDYGDIAVRNGDTQFTFDSARKHMSDIVEAGAIPIVFGGDHSLSYPLIETFASRYDGNIGILHFDAHTDNMDAYGHEKFGRCSPFHRLYDMNGFEPANLVSIGIRGPRNHYGAIAEAKKYGAAIITSLQVKQEGYLSSIKRAIEIAQKGTSAVYISVCSDALDIACNPGGPADPCGLTSFELSQMLYQAGLAGASGFDYMEVYPPDDLHNISSHVACWMAIYAMSGMAQGMLAKK